MADCFLMKNNISIEENTGLITNGLTFALSGINFVDFEDKEKGQLGYASVLGLPIGVAERSVEIVSKCGTTSNFIFSYGNGSGAGTTFGITHVEFVGYYNGVSYGSLSDITGKTRHIVVTNYNKDISIYVNGVLVVSDTLEYSCAPNDTTVSFNVWRSSEPLSASGCELYELRCYNKVLSEEEIKNNFDIFAQKYTLG